MHGLLLFAHGARDPAWARPFEKLTERLRQACPDRPVVLGFLELMAPDLPSALQTLIDQGCDRVTLVPLFLGAGGHIRRDLPRLLDEARAAHPQVRVDATHTIGESDVVIEAIASATLALIESAP
jgi:sirohydrochlorin cobaltochelatase